jgi:hypothetical protein
MSLREFVRPGEELFFFNDLLRAPKVDCKAAPRGGIERLGTLKITRLGSKKASEIKVFRMLSRP